ncbi:MAG: hypothetical protein E7643_04560 [Ruminococcaceae bacterium]|nr:hypothetical protein [Oscillospiraceae bacterium]
MRILRLHIENFGRLKDFSMELSSGLNVLHHENGWGKSTLAVFIKAMLYGLPATSKRSLDENERKKYTPWQGGAYGGSLEFESEKGRFRAERFFGAKESSDTFALYDLDTNLESRAYSEALGVELFGIDADGYERTVYLSQRGFVAKGENYSIAAKLGDLLDDVDDIGGFDAAAAALDKRCKYYVTTGNRGRIAVLEGELADREREVEGICRVRASLEEREDELDALLRETGALEAERERIRVRIREAGEVRERAALYGQQKRMRAELDALTARREALDRALGGLHPDEETLTRARKTAMELRELSAHLGAIPDAREIVTEILPREQHGQLPTEECVRELSRANEMLRNTSLRLSSLEGEACRDARFDRFERGVPSDAEISDAFAILKGSAPKTGRGGLRPGGLLSIAGFAASALFLLMSVFTGGELLWMIALGVSLTLACGAALAHFWSVRGSARREQGELSQVRSLLRLWGMREDGDLWSELTELSLLVREYLRQKEEREERARKRAALKSEQEEILSSIQGSFRALGIVLPPREDYRNEIEAIVRDASLVRRAREEEHARRRRKRDLTDAMCARREELAALLPKIGCREGQEVLASIDAASRLATEYRLIDAQCKEKEAALEEFLAAHPSLADEEIGETLSDVPDVSAMSEEEKALSARLGSLSENRAALLSQIERLSLEADRLPEAEAVLLATREELETAQKNSETVAATLKFLEEAKVGLSTRYLDGMQKSFCRYLELLRPDAEEAVMDASFEVSLRAGGKTRSTEFFSRGWRDALQFCTRLSLTDALYGAGEKPCLVLDDPFVNLDDVRLHAAKEMLTRLSSEFQILYMVCHAGRG